MVVTLTRLKPYHSIDALFKLYRMILPRRARVCMSRTLRVNQTIAIRKSEMEGAGSRIRTDDLLITNQLLYQLSYAGIYEGKPSILIHFFRPLYPSDKNGHNVRIPFHCRCALSAFPPKRQAHSSS